MHRGIGFKAAAATLAGLMSAGPMISPVAAYADVVTDGEDTADTADEMKKDLEQEQPAQPETEETTVAAPVDTPVEENNTESPAQAKSNVLDSDMVDEEEPTEQMSPGSTEQPADNGENDTPVPDGTGPNTEGESVDSTSDTTDSMSEDANASQSSETSQETKPQTQQPAQSSPAPAPTQNVSSAPSAPSAAKPAQTQDVKAQYQAFHYIQDMTTEEFIATIGEQARQIGQEHDLYASVMIAQAILESGSGSSKLSQAPYNNLFGIKGTYEGAGVTMPTSEDDGFGNYYKINAEFRAYDNSAESLEDYANLLDKPIYIGAHKEHADTPHDAAIWLQGRYATSTTYAAKLDALIETYDLTRYDEPLDWTIVGTITGDDGQPRDLTMDDYIKLEAIATSRIGVPYVWGGESLEEGGFDCSGLVYSTYRDALGITLPRVAASQARIGNPVDVNIDDLQMGDLLFYQDSTGYVHHVVMYLGDGYLIEAPHPGASVRVMPLEERVPSFAKRIIETKPVDDTESQSHKGLSPEAIFHLELVK